MKTATIIIPTHDHGPTLEFSIPSVLAQTQSDFELFVIGDGISRDGRKIAEKYAAQDSRVRFFDFPKSGRHGEEYRHQLLSEQATGEIVCYLADDDMWLPDHLEVMAELLKNADFAHVLPCYIDASDHLRIYQGSLALPEYREDILVYGLNFIPFGTAGHTLEFYKRLPRGWRSAPKGTYTDLYMWQQVLSMPGIRAVSSPECTYLNFPSSKRKDWSLEMRLEELSRWRARADEAGFQDWLRKAVCRELIESRALLAKRDAEKRDQLFAVSSELARETARANSLLALLRRVEAGLLWRTRHFFSKMFG